MPPPDTSRSFIHNVGDRNKVFTSWRDPMMSATLLMLRCGVGDRKQCLHTVYISNVVISVDDFDLMTSKVCIFRFPMLIGPYICISFSKYIIM